MFRKLFGTTKKETSINSVADDGIPSVVQPGSNKHKTNFTQQIKTDFAALDPDKVSVEEVRAQQVEVNRLADVAANRILADQRAAKEQEANLKAEAVLLSAEGSVFRKVSVKPKSTNSSGSSFMRFFCCCVSPKSDNDNRAEKRSESKSFLRSQY